MGRSVKQNEILSKAPYYLLIFLLVSIPLIFTENIENGFELTKAAGLKIIGGLFAFSAFIYLLFPGLKKKKLHAAFVFDKIMDPYVAFFLLAAILSTLFSIKPYVSFYGNYERQIGLVTYLYLYLIYFFSSKILYNGERISLVIKAMELTAVIAAVYSILQYLHIDPFNIPVKGNRVSSTFSNSIFAGGFMAIVYPFSLYGAFINRKKIVRIIPAAIIVFSIIITQSRGSYAALIAETLIIVFCFPVIYRSNAVKFRKLVKYFLFSALALIIILIFLFLFVQNNPFINRFLSIMQITSSARWLLWRDSLKAFILYPVTGSGIATFSNVFEKVITFELRKFEVNRYYDNSHNNLLQVLCTMGLTGAISYLLLVIQSIRISIKGFLNRTAKLNQRFFFLAVFTSLAGYIIYGIADFDNISILLYLFAIFALLKSSYSQTFPETQTSGSNQLNIFAKTAIPVLGCLIIFSFYISYRSVIEMEADSYYLTGKNLFLAGDFNESIKALNNAVELNSGCADYKVTLANYVYTYCANNVSMNPKTKSNLLKQAEEEIERSRENIKSELQYKSLKGLILLEEGNTEQGQKFIEEVFKTDSLALPLRNNLARYYMGKGEYDLMFKELKFISIYDPLSMDLKKTYLIYYMKTGDTPNALLYTEQILKAEPKNTLMQKLYEELKNKQIPVDKK